MAPFDVALVPIGMGKSARTREVAERLHDELQAAGVELLLDDRDERPGIMFADMELIGVPHRIVVGERGLKEGKIEYQGRRDAKAQQIALEEAVEFITSKVGAAQ
jgi:prolyl-tRNA synthetase